MRRIIYDPPLDPCSELYFDVWEKVPQNELEEAGLVPLPDMPVAIEEVKSSPVKIVTAKQCIYIEVDVRIKGYQQDTLNAFLVTGAGFNVMLKHALPKAAWKKASIPLEGILANESIERYEYYATDIKILISGKLFTLDKVWQSTTKGNPDLLLGNTFNIPPLFKLNIPFNLP